MRSTSFTSHHPRARHQSHGNGSSRGAGMGRSQSRGNHGLLLSGGNSKNSRSASAIGVYNGAAAAAAPKPIQTSSIKAECGVFDLTAVLVPSASRDKNGTWGRAPAATATSPSSMFSAIPSRPLLSPGGVISPETMDCSDFARQETETSAIFSGTEEEERLSSTINTVQCEPSQNKRSVIDGSSVEMIADSSATTLPSDHLSAAEVSVLSQPQPLPVTTQLLPATNTQQYRSSQQRKNCLSPSPPSPPVSKGIYLSSSPHLNDSLFPPLVSSSEQLDKNPSFLDSNEIQLAPCNSCTELHRNASLVLPTPSCVILSSEPSPTVFQTPSPEEADTEEEKERRRKALAIEQQRLILEQVKASRSLKTAKSTSNDTLGVTGGKGSEHLDGNSDPKPMIATTTSTITSTLASPEIPKYGIMMRRKDASSHPDASKLPTKELRTRPIITRNCPRTQGRLYSRLADGILVEKVSALAMSGLVNPHSYAIVDTAIDTTRIPMKIEISENCSDQDKKSLLSSTLPFPDREKGYPLHNMPKVSVINSVPEALPLKNDTKTFYGKAKNKQRVPNANRRRAKKHQVAAYEK